MLLFKQRINTDISSQDNEIGQIQNKTESRQSQNEHLPTVSFDKNSYITSIPSLINNRYGIEINTPIKEVNSKSNLYTLNDNLILPKSIPNLSSKKENENKFYAKVILKNSPSASDIITLLEDYLTKNNYKIYYETSYETDKITFTFFEEKIAFDFTKLIYNEKNKNPLYKNIIVHLSLSPNQAYIKKNNENKRRGISPESILKLFNGNSYVKKPKSPPRINGNINFGIKSPFHNYYKAKNLKLINSKNGKSFSDKNFFNKNNVIDNRNIDGYVGYDGKPLKNYEKLKINVLDTHYNPNSRFVFREDNKKNWLSPSNFKLY